MRLSKLIAESGVASRREAERLIMQGRVSVGGIICKVPTYNVDIGAKIRVPIAVDGVKLRRKYSHERPRLWAIHKLRDEFMPSNGSGAESVRNRKLLLDRVRELLPGADAKLDLKPVYHVEYETEGLCLFTNDGGLAKLLDQSYSRQYKVRVHGLLTESKMKGLQKGLHSNGK
jgi:23S rRNA pseudouridine2605 synthase